MSKTHYAGGVTVGNTQWLRGWPCCCSGEKAIKIRVEGNVTFFPDNVTCKACNKTLEKGSVTK